MSHLFYYTKRPHNGKISKFSLTIWNHCQWMMGEKTVCCFGWGQGHRWLMTQTFPARCHQQWEWSFCEKSENVYRGGVSNCHLRTTAWNGEPQLANHGQRSSREASFHGRISAHDYESLLRGRAKSRRPLPVSLRIAKSEDAPTQCDCCVFLNVQQSHHVN